MASAAQLLKPQPLANNSAKHAPACQFWWFCECDADAESDTPTHLAAAPAPPKE